MFSRLESLFQPTTVLEAPDPTTLSESEPFRITREKKPHGKNRQFVVERNNRPTGVESTVPIAGMQEATNPLLPDRTITAGPVIFTIYNAATTPNDTVRLIPQPMTEA